MISILSICMTFLLGAILGVAAATSYWVWVLRKGGLGPFLAGIARNSPTVYASQCPRCNYW